MNKMKIFRTVLATVAVVGMTVPQVGLAARAIEHQIPVDQQIENVRMSGVDTLRGAIVDPAGKPVVGATVVVGQAGKVVAEATTNADGEFEIGSLHSGVYQIASHAKSQNVRLWHKTDAAPVGTKNGVVHVMPENIARGNGKFNGNGPLLNALSNPYLIAGGIAAAIAIGVAVSQDDDDAS